MFLCWVPFFLNVILLKDKSHFVDSYSAGCNSEKVLYSWWSFCRLSFNRMLFCWVPFFLSLILLSSDRSHSADGHSAHCLSAECPAADCLSSECHSARHNSEECHSAVCHSAVCHSAVCHSANFHSAECSSVRCLSSEYGAIRRNAILLIVICQIFAEGSFADCPSLSVIL